MIWFWLPDSSSLGNGCFYCVLWPKDGQWPKQATKTDDSWGLCCEGWSSWSTIISSKPCGGNTGRIKKNTSEVGRSPKNQENPFSEIPAGVLVPRKKPKGVHCVDVVGSRYFQIETSDKKSVFDAELSPSLVATGRSWVRCQSSTNMSQAQPVTNVKLDLKINGFSNKKPFGNRFGRYPAIPDSYLCKSLASSVTQKQVLKTCG